MSRDPNKLRVFGAADALVIDVYRLSGSFPLSERFGLQSQLRRAAVSTAANIVEGCARRSTREYVNFLNVANGSAAEARYLVDVAVRLGFLTPTNALAILERYTELMKGLQKLIESMAERD